jgi:hypothetical protein
MITYQLHIGISLSRRGGCAEVYLSASLTSLGLGSEIAFQGSCGIALIAGIAAFVVHA